MTRADAWLVVIDMQHAFGDPSSPWVTEGYAAIVPAVEKLVGRFQDRVVFTRFVRDPAEPGHWSAYYDRWSSFRIPATDPLWDITLDVPVGSAVVDEPTFSKWGSSLEAVVGEAPLVLCGVATECCVLSTAYAAADAGRQVTVVADACAGASTQLHDQALVIMQTNAPLITVTTYDDL